MSEEDEAMEEQVEPQAPSQPIPTAPQKPKIDPKQSQIYLKALFAGVWGFVILIVLWWIVTWMGW